MAYSAVIDSIREQRLELVESLAENRLKLVDTLNYLVTTSLSMLQNVTPALETYRQIKEDISLMMNDLDALEQELLQRLH